MRAPTVLALLALIAPPSATFAQPSPPVPAPAPEQEEKKQEGPFAEIRKALDEQRFAEAEKALRAFVEKDPGDGRGWFLLAYTVHVRGARLEDAEARRGRLEEALSLHLRAATFDKECATAFYNAACACALLGRTEDAFDYLERAFESGFWQRELLSTDSDLASLRSDPRFESFLPREDLSLVFSGDVRVLFSFQGEKAHDKFGSQGRNVGDCDGDGVADFAISAPYKDHEGTPAGKVYTYSGRTGTLLWARRGEARASFGVALGAVGDLNRDGLADVLVGATHCDSEAGAVIACSGRNGDTLLTLTASEANDSFGSSVSGVGDFDGDGVPEIFVGAPRSDGGGRDAGRAYLFSGATGELLVAIDGDRRGDEFGASVTGAAQGGKRLLAVGAPKAGSARRGRVQVFEYDNQDVHPHFVVEADRTGVQLGSTYVTFLGDLNGDSLPELFTSDWMNDARGYKTGRAYVLSGSNGARVLELTGKHQGEHFGSGPARAGDVDGDGLPDLIIGAWRNNQGATAAGRCVVISATGHEELEIICKSEGAAFGYEAVGMGDLDGDGGMDFLVTAALAKVRGKDGVGRAFLIAGPRPACTEGAQATER